MTVGPRGRRGCHCGAGAGSGSILPPARTAAAGLPGGARGGPVGQPAAVLCAQCDREPNGYGMATDVPSPDAELVLEEVCATFRARVSDREWGALKVLDGISAAVQPQEFVTLIGPSGCGRPRWFEVVGGLASPRAEPFDPQGGRAGAADRRSASSSRKTPAIPGAPRSRTSSLAWSCAANPGESGAPVPWR